MTYLQAVRYLLSLISDIRGTNFGLERIRALLGRLGQPQRSFRVVHIAGTNGKGSTAAMIESGLRAAGYSTGLYTSPHLIRFNERVMINGREIGDDDFVRAVGEVRAASEPLAANGDRQRHPTFFESVTAVAFCAFRSAAVDWAVVEAGLGGRLDATNVVQPELAVITPIDFDHEAFLGKSAGSIAAEKAGILKLGGKAVFASQRPQAAQVLDGRAAELGVPVVRVGQDWMAEVAASREGFYRFQARKPAGETLAVELPLAGEHQISNALTAIAALDALGVEWPAIVQGIGQVRWAGRLQFIEGRPLILLDAAHNPGGARVLARFLEQHHRGRRIHLIYGSSRDKAVEEVAALLFPCASRVILTRSQVARAVGPNVLLSLADHHHEHVEVAQTLEESIGRAQATAAPDDLIVIAGSVFLVGEALELLQPVAPAGQPA